jgi:hypothetical protein
MAMEGASDRLMLFQMDLLDPSSLLAQIKGTVGVFHLASSFLVFSLVLHQEWSICIQGYDGASVHRLLM